MTLRSFVDATGREWYAFDVVPRAQERRHYDRRSAATQAVDDQDVDRRDGDRRVTVGGQGKLTGASGGWLCFEWSEGRAPERRRLSPIPENWRQCSDAELEAYLQLARRVRTPETEPHPAERRD